MIYVHVIRVINYEKHDIMMITNDANYYAKLSCAPKFRLQINKKVAINLKM